MFSQLEFEHGAGFTAKEKEKLMAQYNNTQVLLSHFLFFNLQESLLQHLMKTSAQGLFAKDLSEFIKYPGDNGTGNLAS